MGENMKRGGRPRRENEKRDSAFGEALKEYLRRVKNFTQAELSRKTGIPEKTLSEMVKGRRTSGSALLRDLRKIIEVLHQEKALFTLEEANRLITTIPLVSALDHRDPEDAKIIALFNTPETDGEQTADQNNGEAASLNAYASSESRDDVSSSYPMPEPAIIPPQIIPSPVSETTGRSERETKRRLRWRVGSVLVALAIILGVVLSVTGLIFSWKADTCADSTNGVTLYTDPHFQGHCHVFPPGDYDLSQFGLDQNVSSLKDPHAAYYVRLVDRTNRPGSFDQDVPQLPADWNDQAHSLHVEKHRPTSCHPGTNGIIAFINTDYSGGCLFITDNIPDLTPFNFDGVIVSIQFVGSYQNTRQLVIYKQPNYKGECGAYWQNQSDLLQCARLALSVQVLPFTPPTPIPTVPGTRYAGNVAPKAILSPTSAHAVIDGNLRTEWVGGHMVELDLSWTFPVTIHRVVVWDRK